MGSFLSRLNNQLNANTVEETDLHSTNYKYPPKIGIFVLLQCLFLNIPFFFSLFTVIFMTFITHPYLKLYF